MIPDGGEDTNMQVAVHQPSKAPYIWAVVVLVLIAAALVMGILLLRPQADASTVITQTLTGLAPTIAAVLAYIKSQETHLSVNSRLEAWMQDHAKIARVEGKMQGVADEQARVAVSLTTPAAAIPQVQINAPTVLADHPDAPSVLVLPAKVTLTQPKPKDDPKA